MPSHVEESIQAGNMMIDNLLFAGDVVLPASIVYELWLGSGSAPEAMVTVYVSRAYTHNRRKNKA